MSIDPEFLQGLVCPVCRGKLAATAEDWLECRGCGRAYPVRDGFPILLPDAARTRKDTDGPGASATPPSR